MKYCVTGVSAPGHEFNQETVSGFGNTENNLIDHILLDNRPGLGFGFFEKLSQGRGVTAGLKWTHPPTANGPTQPEIAELG